MLKPPGQAASILLVIVLALAVFAVASFHMLSFESSVLLLVSGVVFAAAFLKPDFALCILILSMLFSPEIGAGGIPGRAVVIRAEDIFIIVIFFGWLARMAVFKDIGLIRSTPLNRPIAVYVFLCVLSTLLGVWRGEVALKSSVFYLFKYLEYFLIFFMVANNLKSERQAKVFVAVLLATCFLVCLYGLSQIPSGERVTAPFEGKDGGEPNTFAGYLLLMMAVIIGFILHTPLRRQGIVLWGFLALAITVFIHTLSRGGWFGFFPMIVIIIFLNKRARFPLILLLLVVLVLLPRLMPEKMHHRLLNETFSNEKSYTVFGVKVGVSESAAARIDSWSWGLHQWRLRPFLGFGIPGGNVIDNQYVRVLIETGSAGLAVFIWLLVSVFRACVRTYRELADDGFARAVSLGLAAGLVGILVQSLSSADFILIRIMEPFWFLAAVVVMLPQLRKESVTAYE